ncbi:MAG: hypothetical protein ACM65M_18190 [Microcoleus sp.]
MLRQNWIFADDSELPFLTHPTALVVMCNSRSHLIPQILKISKTLNSGTNGQKCDRHSQSR